MTRPCPHCGRERERTNGVKPRIVCRPCDNAKSKVRSRKRYAEQRRRKAEAGEHVGRRTGGLSVYAPEPPPTPREIYLAAARLRCEHRRAMIAAGGSGQPSPNYEPRVYRVRGVM